MTASTMVKWNVYLGDCLVTSVWYSKDCNKEYVKRTLIEHDGHNPDIEIKKG